MAGSSCKKSTELKESSEGQNLYITVCIKFQRTRYHDYNNSENKVFPKFYFHDLKNNYNPKCLPLCFYIYILQNYINYENAFW
jgi:hypothetical protein